MIDIIKRVLDKVLSAQFLITLAIGYSFCFVVVSSTLAFLTSKINVSDFKGILEVVGFSGVLSMVMTFYFMKQRPSEQEKQKEQKSV